MNKPMYQRYASVKPVGVASLCNTFVIAIWEPDDIDQWKDNCDLIAAWSSEEGYSNYHRHKLHYTESGRGYIRKGSLRIYLDEVFRV